MCKLIITLLLGICLVTSGCSVYHLDVEQGNILRADTIKQLKLGMTKQEVQQRLGQPILNNPFSDNRWYYVYTFQKGGNHPLVKKNLIIDFHNGRIAHIYDHYPTK